MTKRSVKREDVEKFVDSIEVDRTILHPEGLEMPCDGPNFGSMKPTVRSESNLQRFSLIPDKISG